jgi:peptidylprolyl isomerase
VLVTAALAGCTAIPGFGGCDPAYDSGDTSSTVTADGKIGSVPDVDFPTPLVVKNPEATTLVHGDGARIGRSGQVDYAISWFDGTTGELQQSVGYGKPGGKDSPARSAVGLPDYAISEALTCASVGDRIALTATYSQAFPSDDPSKQNDATMVYVLDVLASYADRATGFNQLPQDGLPVVVTEVDGTPGIALGTVERPTTTRVETVKGGSGATVREDSRVVAHLRLWSWPTSPGGDPAELASTWGGSQQAATLTLQDTDDNNMPPGVRNALKGAKVGSQLLIVIPPGDDGYATPPQGVDADTTMIWVVDILGIQK